MVPALPELGVRRGRGRTGTPPPVFHQMALNGLMGTVSPDLMGGGLEGAWGRLRKLSLKRGPENRG